MKKRLTEMFGLDECPMSGVNETVTPALTDDEKDILGHALGLFRDQVAGAGTEEDDQTLETLQGLYTKLGLK